MEDIYVELMTPTMEEIRYAANKGMPYMGSSNLSESLCLVLEVQLGYGILDVHARPR